MRYLLRKLGSLCLTVGIVCLVLSVHGSTKERLYKVYRAVGGGALEGMKRNKGVTDNDSI